MEATYRKVNDIDNGLTDGDIDISNTIDMNGNKLKECEQIDTDSTLKLSVNNSPKLTIGSTIDFNNCTTSGVVNPTASNQICNKAYADIILGIANSNVITLLGVLADLNNKVESDAVMLLDGSNTMINNIKLGDNHLQMTGDITRVYNEDGDLYLSAYKVGNTNKKIILTCDGIGSSHKMIEMEGGTSVKIYQPLDMDDNKISGVSDGTAASDAVNKSQLDDKADSSDLSNYRELTNNFISTSNLVMGGGHGINSTYMTAGGSPLDLVSDDNTFGKISFQAGSDYVFKCEPTLNTSLKQLDMDDNRISNVGDAILSTDAVNKSYVDSQIMSPAYFSATIDSDDTSSGKITWSQVDLNVGINHSEGNITVDQTGIYSISITGIFQGSTNYERFCLIEFRSSTSEETTVRRSTIDQVAALEAGNNYGCAAMTFVYSLTSGVNYSFNFLSGSQNNITLDYRTHCSLHRIA